MAKESEQAPRDRSDLPEFDLVEHLKTDENVANYLILVLEDKDPAELSRAGNHRTRTRHDRGRSCH